MQIVQKPEKSPQPLRKAEKISSAERKARQSRTTRFCQFIQVIRTRTLEIGPICTSCRNPCPNYAPNCVEQPPFASPCLSVPSPADRRLRSCLFRCPKHFSFLGLESIVNLYTLAVAPKQEPFTFTNVPRRPCLGIVCIPRGPNFALRVAGCGLRVAGCGLRVAGCAFLTY
jgi:hypothetical protein